MRMTVIGCGYLGAVHAPCMADLGHDVTGVDVDEVKVKELSAGRAPFYEPGLPELLDGAMATGRLRFTADVGAVGAPGGWRGAASASPPTSPRSAGRTARAPPCTSSAWGRRSARVSSPPTPPMS